MDIVLHVDPSPLARLGLEAILQPQDELSLISVSSPEAARATLEKDRVRTVISEVRFPDVSGLHFVQTISEHYPEVRILVLSQPNDSLVAYRALQAGAHGYVSKHAETSHITEIVRKIVDGQIAVSTETSDSLLLHALRDTEGTFDAPTERLSNRELSVFQLLGHGRSTDEIADELDISPNTVSTYQGRIRDKLECRDSVELRLLATRWKDDL